jgi:hypothetical protein
VHRTLAQLQQHGRLGKALDAGTHVVLARSNPAPNA